MKRIVVMLCACVLLCAGCAATPETPAESHTEDAQATPEAVTLFDTSTVNRSGGRRNHRNGQEHRQHIQLHHQENIHHPAAHAGAAARPLHCKDKHQHRHTGNRAGRGADRRA